MQIIKTDHLDNMDPLDHLDNHKHLDHLEHVDHLENLDNLSHLSHPVTLTTHLAPSFFEKVQIGRSGGPEFWVIWKVRDPQDLIFKTPNRGPESPLPSQKSERPSGPHF